MAEKIKSKKRTADKWKKKIWYTIYAPPEFDRKEIGETVASKPELLIDRVIEMPSSLLSNQAKRQSSTIHFKINEVKGNKAYTTTTGHEIKEAGLMRLIRRRSNKIQVVKELQTTEGTIVRVKAITLTAKKVKKSQETAIRKAMADKIQELNKRINSEKIVPELVFGSTAKEMFNTVKKIVPVKKAEIIKSRIIKR